MTKEYKPNPLHKLRWFACCVILAVANCGEAPSKSSEESLPPVAVTDTQTNENPNQEQTDLYTSRAEALVSKPHILEAFASIVSNRERDNAWLIELNEIAASPHLESKRAKRVKEMFETLGYDNVFLDAVGNVVARRTGTGGGKTTAFVAHLDTVFPPWIDVTVKREGDLFYGPGIGDNTRGVVMLLALAEVMQTHQISTKGDILFIGSVGEEGLGDLRGVRHLFSEGDLGIESFVAIDGGQQERLVTSAVGSLRYKVTFSGPGGHSYGAFGRAHPHQAIARTIVNFTEKATPITALEGAKATFSIGRIGGGTSINSIPFESWLEVDMRSVDPEKLNKLNEAFKSAVDEALESENTWRKHNGRLTVDVELIGDRPAGEGARSSSLVQNAMGALLVLDIEPNLTPSSTDANIPISMGIPAVTISRGGISQNSHAPNESWRDVNSHIAIQAALLIALLEAEYVAGQ